MIQHHREKNDDFRHELEYIISPSQKSILRREQAKVETQVDTSANYRRSSPNGGRMESKTGRKGQKENSSRGDRKTK